MSRNCDPHLVVDPEPHRPRVFRSPPGRTLEKRTIEEHVDAGLVVQRWTRSGANAVGQAIAMNV